MCNCKICGKPIVTGIYVHYVEKQMKNNQMCFSCNLWREHKEIDKERTFAVIKGGHYVLEPHNPDSFSSGMCGRRYTIRFFDGRTVVCDNLWFQGNIPAEWRDEFPDNAEFIDDAEAR